MRCKNPAKTRGLVGSDLEVVPAPFSRFFIANTLHHRLLAWSLLSRTRCVMGSNLVAFVSHGLCDGLKLGSALESVERAGQRTFLTPSPALRERAGVRVSPCTQPIRRYGGWRSGNAHTLFTVALRISRALGYIGYRLKMGVFHHTQPPRTENLPHRPSTKRPPPLFGKTATPHSIAETLCFLLDIAR